MASDPHFRTFGARLRAARKERGLTQPQIATAVGITQPSISELESGESRQPDARTLVQLCKVLRVRADWLLEGNLPRYESEAAPESTRNDIERKLIELIRSAPLNSLELIYETARGIAAIARKAAPRERGAAKKA